MEQQMVLVPVEKIIEQFQKMIDAAFEARINRPEKIYSRKEVANLFGVSLVTLHHWTDQGLIEAHRVGGRVYYKQDAVDAAFKKISKYNRDKAA
jgi:excisionase family DNA binding protein